MGSPWVVVRAGAVRWNVRSFADKINKNRSNEIAYFVIDADVVKV
jgi:hypothetical protein